MADLENSTSQVKVVKQLLDAYASLDMNNVEPLLSKNYQYEPLPESTDVSKQTKESHLQMWRKVFSLVNKHEVCIRHQSTAFKLRLISTTLGDLSRSD